MQIRTHENLVLPALRWVGASAGSGVRSFVLPGPNGCCSWKERPPRSSRAQTQSLAHRVHRSRLPRPQLEARGTLRDEHLEAVEDAGACGGGSLRGRRARIREVDERLA